MTNNSVEIVNQNSPIQITVSTVGTQGTAGPAANFSIGTVTTLGTGASATASVGGSSPNYLINLGIPTGPAGPAGAAANMAIGTVTTGAAGTNASATITGTGPNYTLNLTIPRGNVGPANTLTVGTVTKLAPGATPTVTITGTAPNQTIDFGIPQGEPGTSGSTTGVSSVNGRTGAVTLAKSDVGLTNVDNTSDLNKPISNATQTALMGKENTITAGTTAQYYRGDKTWQTLDKTVVGLANVNNVAQVDLTSAQTIGGVKTFTSTPVVPDNSFGVSKISAGGTRDATTYLRGDGTWAVPAGGGGGGTPSNMVTTDTDQTITAVKTFSLAPVVPDASFTFAKVSNLQATLDAKAAAIHTHDDRYYTEAETNSLLASKADSIHIHDDRYYTEGEVNTLISTNSTNDRNRANHTGTQTASTISDFTEAAQDAVASMLAAGTAITLSYDDAANSLTINSTATGGTGSTDPEIVRDVMGVAMVGAAPISITVNDAADTITVSTTATVNSTDAQLRDRTTHTGLQPISTITNLQTTLDRKLSLDAATGQAVFDNIPLRLTAVWKSGDPIPSSVPGASKVMWLVVLNAGENVPAFLNGQDVLVVQSETATRNWAARFDGVGLTDEANVGAGTAGTGDTPISELHNASFPPTVETGDALVSPAIEHDTASDAYAFAVAGNPSANRFGFYFKTPATWPGTYPICGVNMGAASASGSNVLRIVIGSTTSVGSIRIQNADFTAAWSSANGILTTNTWYWCDVYFSQTAGTVILRVIDMNGTVLVNQTTSAVIGVTQTAHDRIYLGNLSTLATTFMTAHFRMALQSELTTAIDPVTPR